jgi:hypothetical protein
MLNALFYKNPDSQRRAEIDFIIKNVLNIKKLSNENFIEILLNFKIKSI